ncbi:ATP-binding protein [Eubacteriales bacterium DFI.9.88]|nr:PAS domain S-box protein [Anaerovorax odorimutans]MDE8734954.1 ATP-binding protein [Eubacteriales bacterium DFI.9.88]
MYFSILLAFALVTLAISFTYFYMFSRRQERFMKFWGFSWVAYSFSLLFLIIFINTGSDFLLEIRKVVDMFNILLLLFGVFAFMHVAIPTYWYRFSLYMILLAGICMIYRLDLLSYYLPISLFQIATAMVICYNVARYWSVASVEKYVATVVFFMWGVAKALLSIMELYYTPIFNLYMTEIMLSNILNFCILTIYVQYTRQEAGLTEHLYQTVVENASDAIFYYRLTPYHAFAYVTPSVEVITGYSPKMFYEAPRLYVHLVKEKYLDGIEDIFNGKIQHDEGQVVEIIKKNGESFWGEIKATVITGTSKKPAAVEGILRDITVMKSAQLEQIQAKHSRDLLLSYISHELRTPVTSIAGYLTALEDGVIHEEGEVKEAMEIITSKTLILKKLIDDLDQLSKLETHQFSFEFMTCTVKELVDHLLSEYFLQLRTSGLSASIKYSRRELDGHWLVADEARISQVFSNLLSNAIKYSDQDSTLSIVFKIDETEDVFVTSVTNTGRGISRKDLPYVFDRFYRAAPAAPEEKSPGRGLGLTISKEIIKSHGGMIFAESIEGKSTTFTFTIPLYKEDSNGTGKNISS